MLETDEFHGNLVLETTQGKLFLLICSLNGFQKLNVKV